MEEMIFVDFGDLGRGVEMLESLDDGFEGKNWEVIGVCGIGEEF